MVKINNGIDAQTVNNTLERVANYPKDSNQVVEVVQIIANMKNKEKVIRDEKYFSELIRNNNVKIRSALNEGISPREIVSILINSLDEKQNKTNIVFVFRLICEMKKQELKLKNTKSYQKQLIKE